MAGELKRSGIHRSIGRPRLWLLVLLAIVACGPSAPFNSYDPPPTFAYKYVAANPYLAAKHPAGSVLVWDFFTDMIHPTFTTEGTVYGYEAPSPFNNWRTVTNGRWPATWRVESTNGCGRGSSAYVPVSSKMIVMECTERPGGNGSMDPGEYWADEVPHSLTFSFDPNEIPDGTAATIYFVDEYGGVVADYGSWVDSNGTAVTDAPALDPGQYYVLVEFPDIEYDGVQLELTVLNPYPYVSPVGLLGRADPDHRRSLFDLPVSRSRARLSSY